MTTIRVMDTDSSKCLVVDCLYWLKAGRQRKLRAVRSSAGHRIELLAYLVGMIGKALRDMRPDGIVLCLADVEASWSDNDADSNTQEVLCFDNFKDIGMAWRESSEWDAGSLCAMAAGSTEHDIAVILSERGSLQLSLGNPGICLADRNLNLTYDPGWEADSSRWLEYVALCGAIPSLCSGIHSIGPKSAAVVVNNCDSVENLLAGLEEGGDPPEGIPDRILGCLMKHRAELRDNMQAVAVATQGRDVVCDKLSAAETDLSSVSPTDVFEALKTCGLNSGHSSVLLGAVSLASVK